MLEQLVDYIRCDLGHCGGITEGRKIAAIAEPYYVHTAWHGPGDIGPITHAANVHLDLAIPNFGVQEMVFFSDAVREVIPGAPSYQDGYLTGLSALQMASQLTRVLGFAAGGVVVAFVNVW